MAAYDQCTAELQNFTLLSMFYTLEMSHRPVYIFSPEQQRNIGWCNAHLLCQNRHAKPPNSCPLYPWKQKQPFWNKNFSLLPCFGLSNRRKIPVDLFWVLLESQQLSPRWKKINNTSAYRTRNNAPATLPPTLMNSNSTQGIPCRMPLKT